jgi:ABC-type multidrug transport system fused ATPase/permease subunit
MPLFDLFWSMLWFFVFISWIMLLFRVFGDIFRSDMSGVGKAFWVIFVVLVPLLGVLIYLIAHGGDMQKRAYEGAAAQQQAQQEYIQSVAGSGQSGADELQKLSSLHQSGVLTDAEFADQKQKILSR